MFNQEVKLKSGGYLVIHPTEALVAIDVNSGGATKERNIEKTALKTNLEAAEEIAKQIKIRDLSGLIVIDFIDMYEMRNNRTIEKKVKELIKNDRARIQISRISQFGLLEMSRQRLRQSFIDWKTELSISSSALKILYSINEKINNEDKNLIEVNLNPTMLKYLNNNMQNEVESMKNKSKVEILLKENDEIEINGIEIKTIKNIKKSSKKKSTSKTRGVTKKTSINTKKKQTKSRNSVKKNSSKVDKEVEKVLAPTIKEIKNKKSGWWQQ